VAGVPHLNELNKSFREKGFEIVAVSDEAVGKIEEFIKSKSPTYGIVNAKDVLKTYGGRGYPSAWVLDADGKCIWEGHPNNIKDEMVEEWVKGLAPGKITKEVQKQLKPAVDAYNKGQFGKAFEAVAEHLTSEDEKVKADAEYVNGVIEKRKAAGEAKAKKFRDAGDLVKLLPVLEEEAKGWEGSEYGKTCGEEAKTVKASKEYKLCVKAADAWAKLEPKLVDLADDKAVKALEKFIKDYPNTPQAKLAEEKLKDAR
jgi:hypothetical protein